MLIVGLGNPGHEYENTRHNVGFKAIDLLAEKFRVPFTDYKEKTEVAVFSFKGERHILAKPLTYMNLSGEAVSEIIDQENLTPQECLIIVDDVSLPLGKVRLRHTGGSGGHNGLKSIIGHIGENFWRLRIGVGMPKNGDLVSHVLNNFTIEEEKILNVVLQDVPEIVILLLLKQGEKAMSLFNCRKYGD